MKATDLEKDLLIEFFKIEQIDPKERAKSLDEIEVLDRAFTGPGFLTKFRRHECLKVANSDQSFKWDKIAAYLNDTRIHVGFLFYIEKGYIETVEGFTFGETWPEKIICYDFSYFLINDTMDFG